MSTVTPQRSRQTELQTQFQTPPKAEMKKSPTMLGKSVENYETPKNVFQQSPNTTTPVVTNMSDANRQIIAKKATPFTSPTIEENAVASEKSTSQPQTKEAEVTTCISQNIEENAVASEKSIPQPQTKSDKIQQYVGLFDEFMSKIPSIVISDKKYTMNYSASCQFRLENSIKEGEGDFYIKSPTIVHLYFPKELMKLRETTANDKEKIDNFIESLKRFSGIEDKSINTDIFKIHASLQPQIIVKLDQKKSDKKDFPKVSQDLYDAVSQIQQNYNNKINAANQILIEHDLIDSKKLTPKHYVAVPHQNRNILKKIFAKLKRQYEKIVKHDTASTTQSKDVERIALASILKQYEQHKSEFTTNQISLASKLTTGSCNDCYSLSESIAFKIGQNKETRLISLYTDDNICTRDMRDESGKVREDAITIKDYGTAKKRIENLKGQPSYFEVDAEKLDENTRQNIYGHKSVDTDLTELPTVKYVRIKIGMNEQQDKHYGEPSSSNI